MILCFPIRIFINLFSLTIHLILRIHSLLESFFNFHSKVDLKSLTPRSCFTLISPTHNIRQWSRHIIVTHPKVSLVATDHSEREVTTSMSHCQLKRWRQSSALSDALSMARPCTTAPLLQLHYTSYTDNCSFIILDHEYLEPCPQLSRTDLIPVDIYLGYLWTLIVMVCNCCCNYALNYNSDQCLAPGHTHCLHLIHHHAVE